MQITQSSSLLIDESPLQVLPGLAVLTSLNEAIVLQQVHYWLKHNERDKKSSHFIYDRWWTYNTYENWQKENFRFWSVRTVRRAFSDLEKRGLLISANHHKRKSDRTKWYTIDYDALNLLTTPCGHLGHMDNRPDWPHQTDKVASSLYTENTNRNYTHSKESGLDSEPSSGVCDQSLEATQEKKRPVSKPTPKAPNPLANISTRLKQLGIRASKALQTAANGLTEDELINACDALEEALEQGTVQNKQAWLTQAFRGRYEPADDWVSKAEQERLKQEALERQQEELRQQRQEHLDQIAKAKNMLLELEAKGEVKVYWENSNFQPGGSYAYEYIGHEKRFGVRYPQCDQMPMTLATAIMVREKREQLEAQCEARRRGVA